MLGVAALVLSACTAAVPQAGTSEGASATPPTSDPARSPISPPTISRGVAIPDFVAPPPLHLTLVGSGALGQWTDEIWSAGSAGARVEFGERTISGQTRGDLIVFDGTQAYQYQAATNTYRASQVGPGFYVLGDLRWSDWKGNRCKDPLATDSEAVAGRPTLYVRCDGSDLWLDRETGVVLKSVSSGVIREISHIEYPSALPPELFRFVPPPGSRQMD